MNHDADLVQLQSEGAGDLVVQDGVHDLDLEEVVAAAERAALLAAAADRMIGDLVGSAPVDPTVRLGVVRSRGTPSSRSTTKRGPCAAHQPAGFFRVEAVAAPLPAPGGSGVEEPADQLAGAA